MSPLVAPRARLERATYCLGGTTVPALCRSAKTHITNERNRHRQLLSERSSRRSASRRWTGSVVFAKRVGRPRPGP